MGLSGTITALRKAGHFVATLFPSLAAPWDRFTLALHERLEPRLARFQGPRGRVVAELARQFFWSDYKSDRLDWSTVSPEGARVLRPIFLASLLVCVLLPIGLALPGPSLPASAVEGAGGPIAIASVLLWLGALPLAWGRLVAGAAAANRPALLLTIAVYLYFMCLTVIGAPPSLANGLPALAALLATAASERRLARPTIGDRAWGLLTCTLAGICAGEGFVVFSIPARYVHGHKLLVGAIAGFLVGGVVFLLARWRARSTSSTTLPITRLAFVITILSLAHFGLVIARGDLARFADNSTTLFRLFIGCLWPAWYLIGVGVIFGLLKTARVLTEATRVMVPGRWFVPLGVVALVAMALVFASRFGYVLAAHDAPLWLVRALAWIQKLARAWIWTSPAAKLAEDKLRWIAIADVVAVAWLALRRRLSTGTLAALLAHTLLAMLLVYEYQCQLAGFLRSSAHTATLLAGFAIWLLWLLHKLALRFGSDDSPRWPRTARLAIAGGMLLLVLVSIEARAALRDPRVTDEIFLYLFRGVINVGLPYCLYVYAGRRLRALPLAPWQLLSAFALGALLTMPLAALDHLVQAGSLHALGAALDRRAEALLTTGDLSSVAGIDTALPLAWTIARGVLVVGVLVALALVVSRRARARDDRDAVTLFVVVAAAMGLASFARARIDLPLLPPRWMALVTTDRESLAIDADLIAVYLGCALPALVLTLVARGGVAWRWALGAALALALHLVAVLVWPRHEAWLRATGVGEIVAVLGVAALGVLIALARSRTETAIEHEHEQVDAHEQEQESGTGKIVLLCVGAIVLLGIGGVRAWHGRLAPHALSGVARPLVLGDGWAQVPLRAGGPLAAFKRQEAGLSPPSVWVTIEQLPEGGARAIVERLRANDRASLPAFVPSPIEDWDRYLPGAVAFDYHFENRSQPIAIPVAGTVAVLPLGPIGPSGSDRALVLSLMADFEQRDQRRWELALAAEHFR